MAPPAPPALLGCGDTLDLFFVFTKYVFLLKEAVAGDAKSLFLYS
jgi:hypothetical protein